MDETRSWERPVSVMFTGDSKTGVIERVSDLKKKLQENGQAWLAEEYRISGSDRGGHRLAFAARTGEEAAAKCGRAIEFLMEDIRDRWENDGIAYSARSVEPGKKVAVLFPGQGTQRIGMLSEMAEHCSQMERVIALADELLGRAGQPTVSELTYPSCFTEEEKRAAQVRLQRTENTQPVLAAMESGVYEAARERGLRADCLIGYSFGELVALWADGVYDMETLFRVARERGRFMGRKTENAAMMAVLSDRETVRGLVSGWERLYLANENSPTQTVVSGDAEEMAQMQEVLTRQGVRFIPMRVTGSFHSPYMERAAKELRVFLEGEILGAPTGRVIANYNAAPYPAGDGKAIPGILERQMIDPVYFQSSIERAYADGVRIFVEAGGGSVLTDLIGEILEGRDYEALSLCPGEGKESMLDFETAMARLAVLGLPIR